MPALPSSTKRCAGRTSKLVTSGSGEGAAEEGSSSDDAPRARPGLFLLTPMAFVALLPCSLTHACACDAPRLATYARGGVACKSSRSPSAVHPPVHPRSSASSSNCALHAPKLILTPSLIAADSEAGTPASFPAKSEGSSLATHAAISPPCAPCPLNSA